MAYDALRSLLEVKSAETRYGAFRSLWAMNEHDPFLRDENLCNQFHYHVLDVPGPDMIHVTQSHLPEIVLFGKDQQFKTAAGARRGQVDPGQRPKGDKITVSRFAARSRAAAARRVDASVDEVIRAIVDLGGTYPDVVQALQQAKTDGALAGRFEVDALPQPGRRYDRDGRQATAEGDGCDRIGADSNAAPFEIATPLPDLFGRPR